MKVTKIANDTVKYAVLSRCTLCGRLTVYSDMTLGEYQAVRLSDSICDECAKKEANANV